MLCAFCTNMAAAFALAVVQDWYIYLRRIRLAKFSKSRSSCRRILFLFINTLHGPTYRQTNNLKRTLRPSNRKPLLDIKFTERESAILKHNNKEEKEILPFVTQYQPSVSVLMKKMESYTKPTVTSPNF